MSQTSAVTEDLGSELKTPHSSLMPQCLLQACWATAGLHGTRLIALMVQERKMGLVLMVGGGQAEMASSV